MVSKSTLAKEARHQQAYEGKDLYSITNNQTGKTFLSLRKASTDAESSNDNKVLEQYNYPNFTVGKLVDNGELLHDKLHYRTLPLDIHAPNAITKTILSATQDNLLTEVASEDVKADLAASRKYAGRDVYVIRNDKKNSYALSIRKSDDGNDQAISDTYRNERYHISKVVDNGNVIDGAPFELRDLPLDIKGPLSAEIIDYSDSHQMDKLPAQEVDDVLQIEDLEGLVVDSELAQ